ncbi:hypothetical protein PROFUN_07601 [Planoprotostelium fungivorum]|uniref:Uncharacterized protein n=1 Tax=Planoprotostelium fungivorum TaxID=1890364 RepID=A0A2P6NK19_9EUKA|nr:hypothetical protein PROFUN_07601 [Planoprotostelium fungivorum]
MNRSRIPSEFTVASATRKVNLIKDHESWFITDSTLISQMRDYIDVDRQILDAPNRFQLIHSDVAVENLIRYYPGYPKIDTTKQMQVWVMQVWVVQVWVIQQSRALHVSLFRCDKKLLRRFLESYGVDRWPLMREAEEIF